MSTVRKVLSGTIVAGAGLLAAIAMPVDAVAAKFVARMSIEVQEGHPKHIAMERFAKLVAGAHQWRCRDQGVPQQPARR